MSQQDNITRELMELNSGLASFERDNLFRVPAGYFDHLPVLLLNRARALEAAGAREELALLSPVVSTIGMANPYHVPAGYFDGLEKKLEHIMSESGYESAGEELETLSPLLAGLRNKTTYTTPEGYFQSQEPVNTKPAEAPKARVISLTSRKWFRYAAAAVLIAFVTTIGFYLLNGRTAGDDPSGKSFAWVKKNMKKVSTDDITKFVEMTATATDVAKTDTKEEISNLLKDVSDKEIQDFLKETEPAEPATDDDLILN